MINNCQIMLTFDLFEYFVENKINHNLDFMFNNYNQHNHHDKEIDFTWLTFNIEGTVESHSEEQEIFAVYVLWMRYTCDLFKSK